MPSTTTPSNPYACARSAMCSTRVLEVRRCRVGPLVVVADEDHGQAAGAGEVHGLVAVAARGRALAEPADRDPALVADPERQSGAGRDRQHRREVADHRDQPQARVGQVDVPVPAARRPVGAPHVVGEDPPRLDAADDVDAHVAVQRRSDVVRPHRAADADCGRLVSAPRVEGAGDLALLVEDVPALLDAAGDQHAAVHAEQVLAVEARVLHLRQRADRLGFARDRHSGSLSCSRRRTLYRLGWPVTCARRGLRWPVG